MAEHDRILDAFLREVRAVDAAAWDLERAPGKWSPAALVLHVCLAYEFGRDAASGRASMRLRVTAPVAWLSRTVFLPASLALGRFPRGARAPVEVRPDLDQARRLSMGAGLERLTRAGAEAASALRRAAIERPQLRVVHAYFGPVTPLTALRVLSAHTRHHTPGLRDARPIDSHERR